MARKKRCPPKGFEDVEDRFLDDVPALLARFRPHSPGSDSGQPDSLADDEPPGWEDDGVREPAPELVRLSEWGSGRLSGSGPG